MKNVILIKISKLYLIVMVLFSFYILLKGHNSPGGGFIGGIIISTGFIFYGIINGSDKVKGLLRMTTIQLMGTGLLTGLISLLIPVLFGEEPFTALWMELSPVLIGPIHIGTPLLFDMGIFLVVTGVFLSIIISVMDVLKWN